MTELLFTIITTLIISYCSYARLAHPGLRLFYFILFYPIALEGRRGTTDEFAIINCPGQSARFGTLL